MKQISFYQAEDTPIGEGGMGRVLRGVNANGEPVAIKEILPEFASDYEIRSRTEKEVQLLETLDHRSIVKVYDHFPLNGNFYIVLEYVDGLNIEQYVGQYGALHYNRAIRFMIDVLEAMQYVHEKGIIHRDLKPSNIMIRQDERVCLLDFGIAKDTNAGGAGTVVGTIIGSDGYMSPEQANGFGIDHRADVYSLGCVLYYMLTGKHAYNVLGSDFETRENIVNTPFPRLSDNSKAAFPAKLQEVLDRATDKNMMRRYQSCREFSGELQRIIGGGASTGIMPSKEASVFVTIGRCECDINIPDNINKVSRQHLDIAYRQFTGGNHYVITDHSSNGTFVNGKILHRDSTHISENETPQIYLACDAAYPLDWNMVRSVIQKKLEAIRAEEQRKTPAEPDVTGTTQYLTPEERQKMAHESGAVLPDSGAVLPEDGGEEIAYDGPDTKEMSFLKAWKLFFTRAFDFRGRSRRKEYWYVVLGNSILGLLNFIIAIVTFNDYGPSMFSMIFSSVVMLFSLVCIIPGLSLVVRRLHDTGHSWYYIFMGLIPVVGGFILLFEFCSDSQSDNEWGPCPK